MIEIIPAIDLIDGKCVRLVQGDFSQKTHYSDNPLNVAKEFEAAGIKRLHVVDLDGARQKKIVNHKVLELIASNTKLHIDFGGGLQSDKDVEIAFNSGARQITGGSIAIKNPDLFESWIKKFGPEKIILGADTKNAMIAVSGWQEVTEVPVHDFVEGYKRKGIKYVFSTDISKDGLLQGPSFELYDGLKTRFPDLKIIASGGISSVAEIDKLNEMGIYAVIVGKAYYEGRIKLSELKEFL
ncbi:MAG: 1-(5-phosphoribosyl)-5-[(5-phosphoribosylamino)methylideneamino]imidazole-4-carboxamide isomerase [Cytophagaceae bacterium]|nr:1-(5-phosphoribosyl)-5-[(5-phosphoribosylamino)methylideneamino]imidazole-4-carboxamide isomerase [Cytophagaceae bacterium]